MKRFTKLMLTLALCVLGVGSVNATKLYANLSANVGTEGETNVWWIASTHTLGWKLSYSNSFELQLMHQAILVEMNIDSFFMVQILTVVKRFWDLFIRMVELIIWLKGDLLRKCLVIFHLSI